MLARHCVEQRVARVLETLDEGLQLNRRDAQISEGTYPDSFIMIIEKLTGSSLFRGVKESNDER